MVRWEGKVLPLSKDFDPDTTITESLFKIASSAKVIIGRGASAVAKNKERCEGRLRLVDTQTNKQPQTNREAVQTFHIASLPPVRSK